MYVSKAIKQEVVSMMYKKALVGLMVFMSLLELYVLLNKFSVQKLKINDHLDDIDDEVNRAVIYLCSVYALPIQ